MGILSRISKVLESNVNSMLDRAEDPAKLLDQAITDMKKGQEEARTALVDAKTEMRLSEKRRDRARSEAAAMEQKAMQALKASDEPLARRFLEQKLAAEERGGAEDSACEEHDARIKQLESSGGAQRWAKQLPAVEHWGAGDRRSSGQRARCLQGSSVYLPSCHGLGLPGRLTALGSRRDA